MSIHPAPRTGTASDADTSVVHAEAGMKVGQLVAGSISLVVAGLLLARGFIGFSPGRPLFVVLGIALAASATLGLAVDHVRIRPTREHPSEVFASELARSRRYRHHLALLEVDGDAATEDRVVQLLRASDRAWHHHRHLRILLPETDAAGAHGLAARLERELGVGRVRAATFPDDALTMEGLEHALASVGPDGADRDTADPTGPVLVPPLDDRPPEAVGER